MMNYCCVTQYMPCFSPLQAFYRLGEDGKKVIKFATPAAKVFTNGGKMEPLSSDETAISLPCGKCPGCRLEHSRQWAVRIMHEAQMHEDNCFLTLTYSPEKLPKNGSLVKEHFQDFMKRLRKKYVPEMPESLSKKEETLWVLKNGIRYYQCGEYGELEKRPHYHACMFNLSFADKVYYKTVNGNKLYTSKILEDVWSYGFCTIGDLTFQSAAYVARYCMKKVNGTYASEYYGCRLPEYATMSRNPGIGRGWYEKFKKDLYPDGFVVVNGEKCKIPRYYDTRYAVDNEDDYQRIKEERVARAEDHSDDNTYRRLKDREKCNKVRSDKLLRSLEI